MAPASPSSPELRAGRSGALQALREGTRAEHDAIERLLDWRMRASYLDTYREWLERLYGFHRVWEPAVARALGDPAFTTPRGKLDLLELDLDRLGMPASARGRLPLPPFRFAFGNAAEALGSMYVLEGSTLGGQLIARHVAAALQFEPNYHASYRRETGAMWRGFQLRLARAVTPEQEGAAVAAAIATFQRLGRWLTGSSGSVSA